MCVCDECIVDAQVMVRLQLNYLTKIQCRYVNKEIIFMTEYEMQRVH